MDDLESLSPQQVTAELHRTITEIGELVRSVSENLRAATEHLRGLGRLVYQHDTWTCPASVAHALAEVYRHFDSNEEALSSFVVCHLRLLAIGRPGVVTWGFYELDGLQNNILAPLTPVVAKYLDQLSMYLDSDPDSLITQARRQWRPKEDDISRVSFAHNQFSAKQLTKKCAVTPPRRCVTLYRYHYRLVERSVQELAAPVSKYRQQYMFLMRLHTERGDRFSMPEDLVEHTSSICEYIWQEPQPFVEVEVEDIQMYTGWRVPCSTVTADDALGAFTVEDALGAFESWATPDKVRDPLQV